MAYLAMVALRRLPSLMLNLTARILTSYEYMNYPQVVQVIVRTPGCQFLVGGNTVVLKVARQHVFKRLSKLGR